jgi:hypothetical protein
VYPIARSLLATSATLSASIWLLISLPSRSRTL